MSGGLAPVAQPVAASPSGRVGGELAVPSAQLPAAGGPPFAPVDFLVTAFLHRWLLVAAFLVPVLGSLAVALISPTRYPAGAVLLVVSPRDAAGPQALSGFGPAVVAVEVTRLVRAEAEILRSAPVVRKAVEAVGVARLYPELDGAPDAVARAAERLDRVIRTDTETGSNVLRVTLTLDDRALAEDALTALVAAYYERRRETFVDDGARLVGAEVTRTLDELRELEAQIQAAKTRFGVLDIGQELSLLASRMDQLEQRVERARESQATSAAQLAAARARLASMPQRVFASEDTSNAVPNDNIRNQLAQLQQERQLMTQNYRPDWPGFRDLDARIATARAQLDQATRTGTTIRREVRNPAVELLQGRVAVLQVETDALDQQLVELARQRGQLDARRLELLEAERQLRDLQRRRDALEQVARQFVSREAGTRLDEDARRQQPPSVRTVQAPMAPFQGRSQRRLIVAGGLLAALVLSAGLLVALTVFRRSPATPSEAERRLQMPALAVFGPLDPAPKRLDVPEETADLAALLRDVRIGHRPPQLIRFVPPAGGGEDGTLVRNLAIELARTRRLETLLVDLQEDGRAHLAALGSRPLPVDATPGYILTFSTVVPGLWVSYEARGSRLLDPQASREEVEQLVRQLREAFDVVLVLGPGGEEESYAAARLGAVVDANVMLMRAQRTRLAAARAVRDFVQGSGGALLGFVMTERRPVLPAAVAKLL